jgi:RNA polymerase sigma factor (sigma-70 family)
MVSTVSIQGDGLAAAVTQAAQGDHAAFATIVRAHHTDMFRVAYLVCGDRDIAEDAVAAAWALAWRRLGTLRDPDRLRPWLASVAANEARRLVRQRGRRAVREVAVDVSVIEGGSDPWIRVGDLDLVAALGRLSADDRSLLALRYVAGLNSTELALATGRSASGTRARLARLLDRLRRELGDD